ncbi:hypothetical protein [Burkholderia ubonensis]|uniref:hypothetical protein n=1 Tax=Burkholderia ubonensis TaxID=101571 RepID=UPI000757D457|nr:hypothetical protein [Burkholderia ubonensis]KVA16695.1 hypothetical protein WI42_18760 [Burkholderia ubonensis]KVA33272.1 hypothetical protein WI43_28265 [Burkholderia ubonensis]KVA35401.1 hypothetical protein WI46_22310 [Burkholderia ubonensis]
MTLDMIMIAPKKIGSIRVQVAIEEVYNDEPTINDLTALDSLGSASIVRVPTGYASSFDRHMPVATRLRLYDDGYAATAATLPEVVAPSHQSVAVPIGAGA